MKKRSMALLVLSVLAVGVSSKAALLAYEGFDYTTGETLNGQAASGGFGWTWAGGADYTVGASSLSMNNLPAAIAPSGGSVSGFGSAYVGMTSAAVLDFSGDNTYYVSYLMQRTGWTSATSGEWSDVNLISGTSTWDAEAGFGVSSAERFEVVGLGDTTRADGADSSEVFFIVGKIVAHATGNDEIYLKAYTEADVIGVSETSSWTITGANNEASDQASVKRLALYAGTATGFEVAYDEIRIGETWTDVVPEPRALGLMAAAGGLFVFIRRRFTI